VILIHLVISKLHLKLKISLSSSLWKPSIQ